MTKGSGSRNPVNMLAPPSATTFYGKVSQKQVEQQAFQVPGKQHPTRTMTEGFNHLNTKNGGMTQKPQSKKPLLINNNDGNNS